MEILKETENVLPVVDDPETLPNRLLDFVDDSLKFITTVGDEETLPIDPLSQPGQLHVQGTETNHGATLTSNLNTCTDDVKPSLSGHQPKLSVSFSTPKRTVEPKETLPLYHSWIGDLQSGVQHPALTSTDNRKTTICGHSTRDSLPKLRLSKFDGDPLHWSDWSSMFNQLFMMLICPLMEKCNIFRTLLLVKLSLQLKDMVTVEIPTMKH